MDSCTRIAFPAPTPLCRLRTKMLTQLKLTEDFLKSGALTVDIFALSPDAGPAEVAAPRNNRTSPRLLRLEKKRRRKITPRRSGEVAPITAPLNRVQPAVRRGDTVRVDVVVRTKKVGHFFPGGTVDAYDTWLELKAIDDKGQTIFWSGRSRTTEKGRWKRERTFIVRCRLMRMATRSTSAMRGRRERSSMCG